jgi:biotin transporter BioY
MTSAKVGFYYNGVQQNLLLLVVCMLGFILNLRCSLAAICLYYAQGVLGLPISPNGQLASFSLELITGL